MVRRFYVRAIVCRPLIPRTQAILVETVAGFLAHLARLATVERQPFAFLAVVYARVVSGFGEKDGAFIREFVCADILGRECC